MTALPLRRRPPASLTSLGTLGSVLVLAGGLVTSPMPDSTWLSQLFLRATVGGRMLGLLVVLTGLGLLAVAWIRLWRGAGHGVVDISLVRRATARWCLPLVVAPPLFSRDGWSYAAQGELTRLGISPYRWGPGVLHGPIVEAVDPQWLWTPVPYGPLPLLGGALAARVTDHPWLLVLAHRGLAVAGLLLLAWALPRLAHWAGQDPAVVLALVLPSPLVLAHGVGGLHNDLLMAGLMAAALVVAAERGWVAGAAVGGLAAAVKIPGGLVCVGVVLLTLPVAATLQSRLHRMAGVGAVSLSVLLGVGLAAGVGALGWLGALDVPSRVDTPLSATSVLDQLVGDWVGGLETAGVVVALGTAGWVALRRPSGDRAGAVLAVATILAVVVVLGPVVHAWYLLWVVPIGAACRLGPRGLAVLVWLSLALGLLAPLDSSLEGMPVAIALAAVVAGGLVVALSWSVRPAVLPAMRTADDGSRTQRVG